MAPVRGAWSRIGVVIGRLNVNGTVARQRADGNPQAFEGIRPIVHPFPPGFVSCSLVSLGR
jgi:hypothetical protein